MDTMPYIELKTNVEIKDKAALKAALGELIAIIPEKTVSRTMVSVVEKDTLCFAGSDEPCAMIMTWVNPETIMDKNKDYCQAVIEEVKNALAIPEKRIYTTVAKVDTWCSRK